MVASFTIAPSAHIWIAHEATAARLLGDPAYETLYDYARLVRVYDLEPPPGFGSITELAEHRMAPQPTRVGKTQLHGAPDGADRLVVFRKLHLYLGEE